MITNKSYYGLVALVHLAVEGRGKQIGLREIAESKLLPQRFLELLFSRLRAMEVLNSVRGASGGYRLARKPSDISLREIVLACEGQRDFSVPETVAENVSRVNSVGSTLTELINRQMALVEANLGAITLADIIEQSGQAAEMYWI